MTKGIRDYLQWLRAAGRSEATVGLRLHQLRNVENSLGPLPEVDGEKLLNWCAEQAWATETRRSYRTTLRGFYRWAGMGTADVLPVVSQHVAAPRPAGDDDWTQALARAKPRVRLILRLAGEIGLRRAEIAQLHTRDLITADDGAALVVHGKGGRQRIVPVSGSLAAEIASRESGWVFPGPHGHLSPGWIGTLAATVLPSGLHSARHRFATRAYRGSHDIRAVQQLLGHQSLSTTERYVATTDEALRAAMLAAG